MDSKTIRSKFLEYFASHGHERVASSAIVPANDPTLYFTNAGMVQFKDVFTGHERRSYSRAATSQKCLRVSGKHNDLEAVGRTPKHHTFFEMLGNFSFGDYFKEDAIRFAWQFLTEEVGLDPERMVATVFAGEDGVAADEEAYAIWREGVGVPAERIFRLGRADNFWSMGDTGPCGPCSEIHLMPDPKVDMASALSAGGPAVDDRWIEVWNLVFMQFERKASGEMVALKRTGVDTGMGLERLTALRNGFSSTYETDLFRPLIERAAELATRRYGDDPEVDISLRVIADHARATVFCIADGVFPEKGGREYVLRRIMRRAIRHGKLIGLEQPFFDQVCLAVVDQLGDVYPELRERREVIAKIVAAEESSFRRTLDRGLEKLQTAIRGAQEAKLSTLDASFVGDLYATDGFPIDLTRLIAEESGLAVDEEAAHGWVATTHGAGDTRVGDAAISEVFKNLADTLPAVEFVGYEQEETESKILAIVRDGQQVRSASAGDAIDIVSARTPFYGRSGGQLGDLGLVRTASAQVVIKDTSKPIGNLIVHHGTVSEGKVAVGESASLQIDTARRQAIRGNHSATHLLHHALREVLGTHVAQKGSEVGPNQLRFDFSHFQAMSPTELEEVELRVNAEIRANRPSSTELCSLEQAREAGAMALFGEKYGDRVRVVRIGGESVELCGGTHVRQAGEIGLFTIVSEESLALGVRRIVALSGEAALLHLQTRQRQLQEAAARLKAPVDELGARVEKLLGQLKEQGRELAQLKKQLATGGGTDLLASAEQLNGFRLLATRLDTGDPKVMREAGDSLRDRLGSGVLVLAGEHQEKATILVMVSKDLLSKVHAGKLVSELAGIVGGKGGGRPDMAQAGGPEVDKIDTALAHAKTTLAAL